jgi:putative transcriptional regulator
MDKELFVDLEKSLSEAVEITSGVREPSRSFIYSSVDVGEIRGKLHLSQTKFARMLGVSPRTVQNWEQGRRRPTGPALALLKIAEKRPGVIREVILT